MLTNLQGEAADLGIPHVNVLKIHHVADVQVEDPHRVHLEVENPQVRETSKDVCMHLRYGIARQVESLQLIQFTERSDVRLHKSEIGFKLVVAKHQFCKTCKLVEKCLINVHYGTIF